MTIQTRYRLRPTANGQHLDIVHAGARAGCGYEVRIPIRPGRKTHALFMAEWLLDVLNQQAAQVHGEDV